MSYVDTLSFLENVHGMFQMVLWLVHKKKQTKKDYYGQVY